MKTYITFGQSHIHRVNGKVFDKDCIAVIDAKDEGVARAIAFEVFGSKFCFTYPEEHWDHEKMMKYFPRGYINLNRVSARSRR